MEQAKEGMRELDLVIDGMSCGHCVARVKQALAATRGVRVKDVAVGSASVTYDGAIATPDAIVSAVSAAGYPARASGAGAPR